MREEVDVSVASRPGGVIEIAANTDGGDGGVIGEGVEELSFGDVRRQVTDVERDSSGSHWCGWSRHR